MNQSDEEDDFHSADEEGFDEEKEHEGSNANYEQETQSRVTNGIKEQCNDEVIDRKEAGIVDASTADIKPPSQPPVAPAKISKVEIDTKADDDSLSCEKPTESALAEQSPADVSDGNVDQDKDDDDEEEEALAERIRERNLQIARKFSAEIARSLKASAPIPVQTSSSSGHEFSDILGVTDGKSPIQPPAPPSTPALSSSFNNCSDTTTTTIETTAAGPALSTTQYAWRLPSKVSAQQGQSGSGSNTPGTSSVKAEDQARHVLDRLNERLSQTDKNLFERVAADIKKVSIRNEEVQETTATTATDLPSALTSITDLGSTIGGWGWSGATKLLSSASQVTSQVGSVLDSVVGVTAAPQSTAEHGDGTRSATNVQASKTKRTTAADSKSQQAPTDITYNDPLVDLTLNAMETIGKKAFEAMTTRDEAGSLQLKGLGRPWEHLLSANKQSNRQPRTEKSGETETASTRDSPPPSPELDSEEILDADARFCHRDSPPPPSSLKLRKRRND